MTVTPIVFIGKISPSGDGGDGGDGVSASTRKLAMSSSRRNSANRHHLHQLGGNGQCYCLKESINPLALETGDLVPLPLFASIASIRFGTFDITWLKKSCVTVRWLR
jgi:hypothetical protein